MSTLSGLFERLKDLEAAKFKACEELDRYVGRYRIVQRLNAYWDQYGHDGDINMVQHPEDWNKLPAPMRRVITPAYMARLTAMLRADSVYCRAYNRILAALKDKP